MSGISAVSSVFVAILVLSILGLVFAWPAMAAQVVSEKLVIAGDGAARVVLEVQLDAGVNEVLLPAPPIPASIVVEFQGEVLPAIYEPDPEPGMLIIAVEAPGVASINYLASVTVDNGVVTVTYKPVTGEAQLIVEPGVVLLNAPASAVEYGVEGGNLVIVFTGEEIIKYTLSVEPPPQETQTATGTTTTTTETVTEEQTQAETTTEAAGQEEAPAQEAEAEEPGEGEPRDEGLPVAAFLLAAIVIGGLLAALFFLRSRGGQVGGRSAPTPPPSTGSQSMAPEESGEAVEASIDYSADLDDVDRRIIEVLRSAGGELYQSDIQRLTGLPKTTVWRHIRKLVEAGILEVIKEGKANRVRLIRDPIQGG